MASALKVLLGLTLAAGVLAGCANSPPGGRGKTGGAARTASGNAAAEGPPVDVGGFQLEALPAQELAPGQCGLFVWSKSERPIMIVYVQETPARATIKLKGRQQTLDRRSGSGARILGHYEQQTFASGPVRFELDLSYANDRPIQEGALIERGVLRSTDPQGAVTVVPVGGMIGCMPPSR